MEKENLKKLIQILSIPSRSNQEQKLIRYVLSRLNVKRCKAYQDRLGNIYITKGESQDYPCFVAHLDTVHEINNYLEVITFPNNYNDKDILLTGYDFINQCSTGIGGDDKCGVFMCLDMLEKLEHVKIALFVGEEIGMKGSKHADPEFFKDVSYAIQFDSPEGNTMSMTLNGIPLFDLNSNFGKTVTPLLLKFGINKWEHHPFTDTLQLLQKFNFPCLNLAAGYYKYHFSNEYVKVKDVENTLSLSLKIAKELKRFKKNKIRRK